MSPPTLYYDDILLWSEQQAAVIRRLATSSRVLPNELDIENVAEEIESVGRSEMASVESFLRLMMLHLLKIASAPDAPAALHWRDEARNFSAEALTRFAPSMAQRIDIERAWQLATGQARASLAGHGDPIAPMPKHSPWSIEELVRQPPDLDVLVSRMVESIEHDEPKHGS